MVFGRYDYAAFLMFGSYSACSIVIPLSLVQISDSLGFSLTAGGLGAGGALQLGRSFMMVVSMLFCGLVAGKIGTKRTMVLALILMGLSIMVSAISPWYGLLFVALAIAGLGEGVLEGLATPFVQDLHKNDEPGRYITFSHAFWSVGVFVTVLLAGYLLKIGINWRYVVGACGFISILPMVLLVIKPHPQGQQYPERKKSIPPVVTWMRAKRIIGVPRFWLFFGAMIFAGGGEFCLTFWCASYVQTSLKASAFMGGVATALFALGMIIGRLYGGAHVKEQHFKQLIIFAAAAGILIGLFFPYITTLPVLMFTLFFLGLASAPFWPSIQSYANTRMRVDHTMLFILLSCAGVPGCGIFTYLMGVVGDKIGFKESFYLVPICYGAMAILIGIDWFNSNREKRKVN